MNTLLAALLTLGITAEQIVPLISDKAGFDKCVAEVNANPDLGGDSDYLHCDWKYDPYEVLYRDERATFDERDPAYILVTDSAPVVTVDLTHPDYKSIMPAYSKE